MDMETRQIRVEDTLAHALKVVAAKERTTVSVIASVVLCRWLRDTHPAEWREYGCKRACDALEQE
jgi:hypothetical protein